MLSSSSTNLSLFLDPKRIQICRLKHLHSQRPSARHAIFACEIRMLEMKECIGELPFFVIQFYCPSKCLCTSLLTGKPCIKNTYEGWNLYKCRLNSPVNTEIISLVVACLRYRVVLKGLSSRHAKKLHFLPLFPYNSSLILRLKITLEESIVNNFPRSCSAFY